MSKGFSIAVSGKGGVGKTGISAHLIKRLSKRGSVLAIDADPDSNLAQVLGVPIGRTVSEVRDAILDTSPRGSSGKSWKEELERYLNEAVHEFPDFALVTMGHSEGQGCYCPHNHVIRSVIDARSTSYDFTVIDCHAGLEHFNRRTTRDVDLLLMVTDPTAKGLTTIKRVRELSDKLLIKFGAIFVVMNRMIPENVSLVGTATQESGINIDAFIPYDPSVAEYDFLGKPVTDIPEDSPFSLAMDEICQRILDILGAFSKGRASESAH